jgi:hypothetical protein
MCFEVCGIHCPAVETQFRWEGIEIVLLFGACSASPIMIRANTPIEAMHERERQTLVSQVEDLKVEAERRSREHMQTLAVLTDQREKSAEPRRRFFGLLKG